MLGCDEGGAAPLAPWKESDCGRVGAGDDDGDEPRDGARPRSPGADDGRDRRRKKPGGGFKFKEQRRDDRDDRDDRPRGLERGYRERAARDDKPPSSSAARDGGKKEKKPRPAASGGEEMIIVGVNDRLGTKAQIPCFASDTVGQFKVMVAARIGREKHEIMLKRQGERPFKDHITLGDYGVSNGAQLDLEMDTGD